MGPHLSTGGNRFDGQVRRRAVGPASMGPRLSTAGNVSTLDAPSRTVLTLQWGPVSRRGGTRRFFVDVDDAGRPLQ